MSARQTVLAGLSWKRSHHQKRLHRGLVGATRDLARAFLEVLATTGTELT
jgi:hypothetical protein